ncbi:MAG: double zinc ribbon domain-containing protein [Thermodesulfobacteriota bacterium]
MKNSTVLAALVDILFPPVCPLCGENPAEGPLCGACLRGFEGLRIASPFCPVCGVPFESSATGDHPCGECIKDPPPFLTARSAYRFAPPVLDAVHRLKYNGQTNLAPSMAALAVGAIADPVAAVAYDVVMPVPLHVTRLRERGFNPSLLLARVVAGRLGVPIDYDTLQRTRMTGPQVGLPSAERRRNVKGAFEVATPGAVEGRSVLLVDDVYTTGSTVAECSRALAASGASVHVLTLARTVKV